MSETDFTFEQRLVGGFGLTVDLESNHQLPGGDYPEAMPHLSAHLEKAGI